GRVSRAVAHAIRHHESFYVGLKTDTEILNGHSKGVDIDGIIVDTTGELSDETDAVTVEIFQLYRSWHYLRGDYKREDLEVLETVQRIPVKSSRFEFSLIPRRPANDYVIRVSAGQARTELKLRGHNW